MRLINCFHSQQPGFLYWRNTSTNIARPHIICVVQRIVFALPDSAPVVMELLTNAEDHLAQNLSSGPTKFNLLQFQKV